MSFSKTWRLTAKLALIIMLLTPILPADAYAKKQVKSHSHKKVNPKAALVARSAGYADIVIEARSGRILHATNSTMLRHPASLTKMMTLYITFQALEAGKIKMDTILPISANASEQPPSKLGLRRGQSIRVQNAVLGLVTQSANDAAMVLGEALGGDESRFAQLMTQQARALGMKQTLFRNPSGLPDPAQVSSARDMAILGHALIYHYPQYYSYFSRNSFTYAGITHENHNHLMERYNGMDGIKTGYVRASGFNLVASAERNNVRLIGVVFGGRSATARDNQMAQLLDEGFLTSRTTDKEADANEAEGDATDLTDTHYIPLPSKTAVVFAPNMRFDLSDVGTKRVNVASLSSPALTAPVQQIVAPSVPRATGAQASGWGVQIGAYADVEIGQQALADTARNLTSLIGQAQPVVQKISSNSGAEIYRARFMGMEEKAARALCTALTKRSQTCLVVAPEQIVR